MHTPSRLKPLAITSLALACLLSTASAQDVPLETDREVLIKFRGAIDAGVVKKHGGKIRRTLKRFNAVSATLPVSALQAVAKTAGVAYVEPNGIAYATKGKPSSGPSIVDTPQETPWGVSKIGADQTSETGAGLTIAIVDTGIGANADLTANRAPGWDFVNNDADPTDDQGHGTHVAGTIAAMDNAYGVVGVAPGVTLMAVKVLNKRGSGSYDDIIAGITWAADNGADIINMSLGGEGASQLMDEAIDYAVNTMNVLVVVAAGNDATDGNNVQYPAASPFVLAVGATDVNDEIGYFSSHGSWVDVSAPGVAILSTTLGDGMESWNGTSMATPHVAAAAALVWASDASLDANGVAARLMATSVDLGDAGWDEFFGHGRIDVMRALNPPQNDVAAAAVSVPETANIGEAISVFVDAANYGVSLETVEVALLEGTTILGLAQVEIAPGEVVSVEFPGVVLPATPGPATFTGMVSPLDAEGNAYDDEDVGNNVADATVSVIDPSLVTVMHVASISYTWVSRARDLRITVAIEDAGGQPVEGAAVSIALELDGGVIGTGTASTAADGTVSFKLRNAPAGAYTTTVTDVVLADAVYDSSDDAADPGTSK